MPDIPPEKPRMRVAADLADVDFRAIRDDDHDPDARVDISILHQPRERDTGDSILSTNHRWKF